MRYATFTSQRPFFLAFVAPTCFSGLRTKLWKSCFVSRLRVTSNIQSQFVSELSAAPSGALVFSVLRCFDGLSMDGRRALSKGVSSQRASLIARDRHLCPWWGLQILHPPGHDSKAFSVSRRRTVLSQAGLGSEEERAVALSRGLGSDSTGVRGIDSDTARDTRTGIVCCSRPGTWIYRFNSDAERHRSVKSSIVLSQPALPRYVMNSGFVMTRRCRGATFLANYLDARSFVNDDNSRSTPGSR